MLDGDARAFVLSCRVGRLATAAPGGRPHAVPVCFAAEGDVVYTAVDAKPKRPDATLRRLRDIAANPRVLLLFDEYDDGDWSRLRYVQVHGQARVLDGWEEHDRALALLRARYAQYAGPGPWELAADARVIAVKAERVVSWSAG
jgi:PPOX class probable F420-dependent enzyme